MSMIERIIEVQYTGLAEAVKHLSAEERSDILYDSFCRNDCSQEGVLLLENKWREISFKPKVSDDLLCIVRESIQYFCTEEMYIAAINLAIETGQKGIARSILRTALVKEDKEVEENIHGKYRGDVSNLICYGNLARKKIGDCTLAMECYNRTIPIILANINLGDYNSYSHIDWLIHNVPEVGTTIVDGLVTIVGVVVIAADYCETLAKIENKRGNYQLGKRFKRRAKDLKQ